MAKRKAPSGNEGGGLQRPRFYSDGRCKVIATRIAGELANYEKHKIAWDVSRGPDKYLAPVVPIWGPDLATVKVKVARLYHPDEAAVIIANLS